MLWAGFVLIDKVFRDYEWLRIPCVSYFSDLEWKMIYVGSAESEEHDQVLDTIYVGPIPEGKHMFVFQVSYHNVPVFYFTFVT